MANTTNYNWETPDDTDLVKDGAAAIRTLGSSVDTTTKALNPSTTLGDIEYRSATANTNTRLGIGSSGQVLTVAAGVPSWATPTVGDITEVSAGTGISGGGTSGAITITNDMATTITASGDIVVGTGSGTYDNLSIGTTGQVLTADTTVSPYKVKWATPAGGGGKVLQVVQGTTTTPVSNSTTSQVDTGITATITPSSATSKILVLTSINGCFKSNGNASNGLRLRLIRGATEIAKIATYLAYTGTAIENYESSGLSYLDSPATTSATTYKITLANVNASASVGVQDTNELSTIVLLEIGA